MTETWADRIEKAKEARRAGQVMRRDKPKVLTSYDRSPRSQELLTRARASSGHGLPE